MGAFQYTALDAAGRESQGILEGDTARQVRQLLRERQLLPVSVNAVSEQEKTRSGRPLSFGGGVSAAGSAARSGSMPLRCGCCSTRRC